MKSYTDIGQSKKLADFLPLETADGFWEFHTEWGSDGDKWEGYEDYPNAEPYLEYTRYENEWREEKQDMPCWSLASLLSVLPFHIIVDNKIYAFSMVKGLDKNGETYAIKYAIFNTANYFHLTDFYNNPIDACYKMVIKLHAQKLL